MSLGFVYISIQDLNLICTNEILKLEALLIKHNLPVDENSVAKLLDEESSITETHPELFPEVNGEDTLLPELATARDNVVKAFKVATGGELDAYIGKTGSMELIAYELIGFKPEAYKVMQELGLEWEMDGVS